MTACTTSTHAMGVAMRTIQYGDADVIGWRAVPETATCAMGVGGFSAGQGPVHPQRGPRRGQPPLGSVIATVSYSGDGGGALVLEELEHARPAARASMPK